MDDHPELEFFNTLSGELEIALDPPAAPIVPHMANLHAAADARIVRLTLRPEVFDDEADDYRSLTPAEFDAIAFHGPVIRLRSYDSEPITHPAPNGLWFTVRDLFAAVEETERQTRPRSDWFGGVDVHHIYFEGLLPAGDGVWEFGWGS